MLVKITTNENECVVRTTLGWCGDKLVLEGKVLNNNEQ